MLLDQRVGELRAALTVGEKNVGVLALGLYRLGPFDRRLQGGDIFGLGFSLEKRCDEIARLALGFLAKRILADERLPLGGRADEDVDLEREAVHRLGLEKAL